MADTPVLSLTGAGFAFHGAETSALASVDLSIGPGEMLAVLGPQGAGTSTLCRLAAALLGDRGATSGSRAVGGSVAMLGDDPEAQLTGMTSYVDDEVRLPARLAGSACPVDVRAALDMFGMQRLIGRRLDTLSGGERQLVALASLMTLGPSLLVLDQPALSLDPDARQRLSRALRRFRASGGAVLLAGHQFDELAETADRVQFLRAGRIVDSTHPGSLTDALLAEHGVWSTVGIARPGGVSEEREPPSTEAAFLGRDLDAPGLHVHGLTVVRGRSTVFQSFDCGVARGEVATIVGPNGTGKSTLLRAIAGMLDADPTVRIAGEVHVGRTELHGLPAHQRARWVGWVGQDPGAQLSSATVQTELERAVPLPPHRRRDRAQLQSDRAAAVGRVLERTGLAEHAGEHPYDLAPAQRKDLVIASALLLRAEVLLLDEPTLGRDLAGMRRLERVIRDFSAAGGAVVVTTHDLRWAGRVAARTVRLG